MTILAAARPAPDSGPPLWHAALAGLIALLVGIGLSRFGYAPLVPALIQEGWFTPAQAGFLGATNLAGYLVGALAARRTARRLPARGLMRGALLVATACFFACAFPLGLEWYLVWRLASGLVGGVLMVLAAPAVLALAPPRLRGRIAGILFTGVGLGIALSGTLVPWLMRFGLRAAWLSLGVASALLTALAWRGLPQAVRDPAALAPAAASPEGEPPAGGARLAPAILLLLIAYGCSAVGFVPHTVFWVDYVARGLGRGLAAGGTQWVLVGLAAACGPLLAGLLADRIGFGASLRLVLFANAAAVALPLVSTAPWALSLSSIGVGCLAIGTVSLASGRVSELVPAEHARQVWSWLTVAFSVLYAGMGYVLSLVFARTGSYGVLFGVGAAALVIGGLLDFAGSRTEGAAP
jgi:predicted MFS family arabinose efflux permease